MPSSPAWNGKTSWRPDLDRLRRRLDPAALRAALWARRAFRSAHRQLQDTAGFERVEIPPPPALPARAERGVAFVLARHPGQCLAEAHVRQAWHAARGDRRDVVIGVRTVPEFQAHAWLDGDPPEMQLGYEPLMRKPPR